MAADIIGPLSSKLIGGERGRRDFYASMALQLDTGETITSVSATSGSASLTVDQVAPNSAVIVDGDRTVAIGEGVQFRATTTADLTEVVEIDLHYGTSDNNYDTATVRLEVVDTIP